MQPRRCGAAMMPQVPPSCICAQQQLPITFGILGEHNPLAVLQHDSKEADDVGMPQRLAGGQAGMPTGRNV